MGCDIHPVLEKKHKFEDGTERWVGLHDFPFNTRYGSVRKKGTDNEWELRVEGHNWTPAFDARNYERFAKLAGVRGDGPAPKGFPRDISDLARMRSGIDGSDGHSHSWCTLREACEICLGTEYDAHNVFLNEEDVRKKQPLSYYFGLEWVDDDFNIDDYRLVFWFDN